MRRRVEQHVPAAEADRQLKLGPGGLRDVEFSVQLLQLVHGRADDSLRSGTTLEALDALARGGYVGREDAATLDEAYRLLRTLEHRIQLFRLRRTHLMPTAEGDLRRLGRALGHRREPVAVRGGPVAAARPRGPPHPRAPLLPAAAGGGRQAQHLRGPAGARGRTGAPRRPRLPRPRRGDAPPRGAHGRGEPTRRHPAHPAAGDARVVRRRGRPRRRAARLPQGERGARLDPLVPAAAARRGVRRRAAGPHPGPQPVRRRPARGRAGSRSRSSATPAASPRVPARTSSRRMAAAAGRKDDPDARGPRRPEHPPPGAVPHRRGRPHRPARPRRGRARPDRPHRRPARGRASRLPSAWSPSSHGHPCRPGCSSSAWAASEAASPATAPTPTSSSSTSRSRGRSEEVAQTEALEVVQELRRLLVRARAPTRSSASTPTCAPRARAARWCAASTATAPTTSAGP